jgi:hypothetical protein
MKKLFVLLFVLFLGTAIQAQDIKEKKLFDGLQTPSYSLWDFRYDVKTGTYVYSPYDTVLLKTKIISNKGNSDSFTNISSYDALFDKNGNYYVIASNAINDTTYTFFFVKNGKVLKQYNNITYPLTIGNDGVYFLANEVGNDFRVKYNFNSDNFEYGNKYDTIYLSNMNTQSGEGEPNYSFGMTKNGEDYYIACKDGKQMLVVGNTEMKAYDEIASRFTQEDSLGNIYYIGKNIVGGKNQYCLVKGDKEFKTFPYVSPPLVFDKDNNPIYCASDEEVEYPSSQYIVKGNDVISRTFSKGIYETAFSPSGKIAYVGADTLPDGTYTNTLYIDRNEYAKSSSISGIMFNNNEIPYYSSMDKDNNSYLVEGTKTISDKYSYIYDVKFLNNNKISYMGTIYGDYEKNIPNKTYYVFGNKKYGPYPEVANYEGQARNNMTNDKGDYAYVATKSIPLKGEEYPLTKYYVVCNDWKSEQCDFISDLSSYKNDFYYLSSTADDKGNSEYVLYKNDEKLVKGYDVITNINIDKSKGVLTFLGQKKNKAYLVEIKL